LYLLHTRSIRECTAREPVRDE